MARPREFDETTALAAAIQCFWARGYEATSTRDLAHEMKITGASLYNAFGDKRQLYRRALEHYVEHGFVARVRRHEEQSSPYDAIAGFLDEIVELSMNDAQRRGCLIVNAALGVAPHDEELRGVVADVQNQMEAFFLRCVVAGQRDGSICATQPAQDLARLLLGVLMGLRVLARTRPERDLLEGLVRPVLLWLRAPGNR